MIGQLHLTPLHAVCRMKPKFEHVDAVVLKSKMESAPIKEEEEEEEEEEEAF